MKLIKYLIISGLLLLANILVYASPIALLQSSRQMMLLIVPDVNASQAALRFFERKAQDQQWDLQPIHSRVFLPAVIGKSGLAWSSTLGEKPDLLPYKKEGDARTPAGVYSVTSVLGLKMVGHPAMPFMQLDEHTACVTDPDSKFFNKVIDSSIVSPDWKSALKFSDRTPDFNVALQLAYNAENLPGVGSCMFMHQWRSVNTPTEGVSIGVDKDLLVYLAQELRQEDNPVIVILPQSSYSKLQEKWGLPLAPV